MATSVGEQEAVQLLLRHGDTPARRHAPGPQHSPAHTCPNQTWGPGLTQRAPYSEKVPIAHCLHVKSSSKQAVGLHLNFHQQAVWLAKILKTAGHLCEYLQLASMSV